MRSQRGGAGVLAGLPPELLESQARIQRHLASKPLDPEWLHAQGLAEVLSWDYNDALRSFDTAYRGGAASTGFWIDWATALFERAESQTSPVDAKTRTADYSQAVEYLSKALAREPANPVALFNRGMVLSRLNLFDQSIQDFEAFLKVEKDTAWAEEGRDQLNKIRSRRSRLFLNPLQPPPNFRLEKAFEGVLRGEEELRSLTNANGRADLTTLAADLANRHGDRWIVDVLNSPDDAASLHAIQVLSAMERVRSVARVDQFAGRGADAQWLRRARLTEPLAVWRDFEFLYQASHGRDLSACPPAEILVRVCERRGYIWFGIQASLERSTCKIGNSEMEAAHRSTMRAIALAEKADLRVALLRAKGFLSSHYVNEGRYRESFQVDVSALDQLSKEGYPLSRAHQFYNDIMRASERLARWNTAGAAATMARQVAAASGYKVQEMQATCKQAEFALRVGRSREAESRYVEALEQYSRLRDNPDVAAIAEFAQIGLLEARGDYGGLRSFREHVQSSRHPALKAPLYNAISRLALQRGDPAEAERCAHEVLDWLARQPPGGPESERRLLWKELETASVLIVRARLARNDANGSWRAWQHLLTREVELLGGNPIPSTTDSRLGPQTAVLTIADLGDGLAVWLQYSTGLSFHWIGDGREPLLREVRKLSSLCRASSSSLIELHHSAQYIWRELFDSITREHPDLRKLYVQAQGDLNSLPLSYVFTALSDRHSIREVAFLPYPLRNRNLRDSSSRRAYVIEATAIHPDLRPLLPPLPGIEEEVRAVAASMGQALVLTGNDATPAKLDAAASTAILFHFAGHALRRSNGVALVATPDEHDMRADARLGLWWITPQTPFHAELVVFSACSTGDLEESDTVAPGRLAEAALLAGSKSVIAALWDIDSVASGRFNAALYKFLESGKSPAEANFAAAHYIRAQPGFAHPYYWSAFALYQTMPQENEIQ